MKIYKFSITLIFVTFVALLYVHQQVQILKMGYKVTSCEKEMIRLLDQNKGLVYNITQRKSPVYLEQKFLATKKDFGIPKQWQVVRVMTPKEEKQTVVTAKLEKQPFGILKIFGKPREAMANSIK
jgi:hypothetical protein